MNKWMDKAIKRAINELKNDQIKGLMSKWYSELMFMNARQIPVQKV